MTCEELKELMLTDFLDGELAGGEMALAEAHLQDCASCREQFHQLKSLVHMPLRTFPELPVPAGLWEKVRIKIGPVPGPGDVGGEPGVHLPWAEIFGFSLPQKMALLATCVLMALMGTLVVMELPYALPKPATDQMEASTAGYLADSDAGFEENLLENTEISPAIEALFLK